MTLFTKGEDNVVVLLVIDGRIAVFTDIESFQVVFQPSLHTFGKEAKIGNSFLSVCAHRITDQNGLGCLHHQYPQPVVKFVDWNEGNLLIPVICVFVA